MHARTYTQRGVGRGIIKHRYTIVTYIIITINQSLFMDQSLIFIDQQTTLVLGDFNDGFITMMNHYIIIIIGWSKTLVSNGVRMGE